MGNEEQESNRPPRVQEDEERDPVSFYLRPSVRQRSRAAFMATRHHESDLSWSHLLEKALVAELERRERLYNDGQPYDGGPERLVPGRRPGEKRTRARRSVLDVSG